MKNLSAAGVFLIVAGLAPGAVPEPKAPYEMRSFATPNSRIDDLVFGRLAKEKASPALPCSDAVFVRRIFVDLIGTLPTPEEVTDFLADKSSNKRSKLIDHLLDREEFADYWTMHWSEVLCVKAEFPINLWPNPAQGYHHYLRSAVRSNVPVDNLARSLLTANGRNMRMPASNFLRAVQGRDSHTLAAASQAFMGVRRQSWKSTELDALAVFFSRVGYKTTSEWKEEIVFFDMSKPARSQPVTMPDGLSITIPPDVDPREVFADWLLRPENPWFSRCVANRIWFWLLGRGIVEEADDFRRDNPPSHPELLAYLANELSSHDWDMRHLIRRIANSRTYQLSSIPPLGARAPLLFASYPIRRMDAEVLVDALCTVTASTETYSSLIPEPFTYLPDGTRAISLPDGSINSSFLELFGRPSRDSGLMSERNPNPTAGQRLHFLNSSHVRNKIEKSESLREILRLGKADDAATHLYLLILSRPPTDDERRLFHQTLASTSGRRDALIDITWALLNTTEFQCRH